MNRLNNFRFLVKGENFDKNTTKKPSTEFEDLSKIAASGKTFNVFYFYSFKIIYFFVSKPIEIEAE